MFFGKPVIATGWSGNMEYMQPDNSFPVRYTLVPVGLGEYPFGDGQLWAEADVAHAAELLIGLIDDPSHAQAIGARARAHMLANFSDAVLGARYRARFEAIAAGK
jgi:glycosyltransferase involved in cell wall biosynthesis